MFYEVVKRMKELNGMKIIKRNSEAIFVRLPISLQREAGTCTCTNCKRNNRQIGHWDTLVIPINSSENDTTFTVHMPD
mgnify:CR=1 FL=1